MNFDNFQPHEIPRFGSLIEQDDPTNLPLGVSPVARNVRFHLTSVRTRDGIQNRYGFVLSDGGAVTGLAALKIGIPGQTDLQVPLAFSGLGHLYKEYPVGSGNVIPLTGPLVTLPSGASMQVAAAYEKGYLAFSNLKYTLAAPAVFNPILNTLDPLSMKLVGQLWAANTSYKVGEVVCPPTTVGGNGHSYRCTVAGTSGAVAPAFSLVEQAPFADNTVTWQENTPVLAQALLPPGSPAVNRSAGAGAFAANRDVYIILSYVNAQGETTTSAAPFVFINTVLNDRFIVTGPVFALLPLWEQQLIPGFRPTGYNVYEADVATGNPAPALATYKKVNGGLVAFSVNTNVDTTGAGAAPPVGNGALVVGAGNICAGLRYLVVLFVNRNGYITGMTQASVVSYNGPSNGSQIYSAHISTGPSNTVARILAFTPAGQLNQLAGTGISNAGPYFWIPPAFPNGIFNLSVIPAGVNNADVVNGVVMTSTLINDNVTTTGTFNFTDDYLKSTLQDVSAYFRKIQVPPCSDVWWSQTLQRNFYAADSLPSGWYVSLLNDPESVYGDKGFIQVAENNGQNRTAIREFQGVVYPMKEKSGHVLTPSTDDPSTWQVVEQWTGCGPCGPRAVDVGGQFMCFVHRSGVYIFQGNKPFWISKEIPISWANVNWALQAVIWVQVDDEERAIRIGVPFGQSTVPNLVLKCDYSELPNGGATWSEHPIHFSPYIGKEIATGESYKWSIDDIAANLAIRAERTLVGTPLTIDPATVQSQILYASSNADGAVAAIIPNQYDDNGVGIDSQIETAAPQDLMRPNRLGGIQLNINGYGQGSVEVLALRAKDPKQGGPPLPGGAAQRNAGAVIPLAKPWTAGIPYSCGARGQNERFRLRITNNKRPGVWFDLLWASIYATPLSSARPG